MSFQQDKIAWLNALPVDEARERLLHCCGSSKWAETVTAARPFADEKAVLTAAEAAWNKLSIDDKLEAFFHHPRLGDVATLESRFASTAGWAGEEQRGTVGASRATLEALASGNRAYDDKFGFVFLLCATGKSADEMLGALQARLLNDRATELANASAEQRKITRLRLEKLLR